MRCLIREPPSSTVLAFPALASLFSGNKRESFGTYKVCAHENAHCISMLRVIGVMGTPHSIALFSKLRDIETRRTPG